MKLTREQEIIRLNGGQIATKWDLNDYRSYYDQIIESTKTQPSPEHLSKKWNIKNYISVIQDILKTSV